MKVFKLMINKSKSKNINKSMYRINIRNCFLQSRISNYYISKTTEQKHVNNFNKLINN